MIVIKNFINNFKNLNTSSTTETPIDKSIVNGPINSLPQEIILKIFSFLHLSTVLTKVALTQKNWYQLSQDKILINNLIKANFPDLADLQNDDLKKSSLAREMQQYYKLPKLEWRKRLSWDWILTALPESFNQEKLVSLPIVTEIWDFCESSRFSPPLSNICLVRRIHKDQLSDNPYICAISEAHTNQAKIYTLLITAQDTLTNNVEIIQLDSEQKCYHRDINSIEKFKQLLAGTHPHYKLIENE